MIGTQTYILRILRRMEARLVGESHQRERMLVGNLIRHLSGPGDFRDALERLYMVEGMGQFALRLMWVASKERESTNGKHEEMLNFELDALYPMLFDDEGEGDVKGDADARPGSGVSSLDRFNRFVADVRRRATAGGTFKGLDEDILARISEEALSLHASSDATRNPEIPRFCEALSSFVRFVMTRHLFSDIRVLNLITNANLTLQTVVGSGISADRSALDQTIGILHRPAEIFDQQSKHHS